MHARKSSVSHMFTVHLYSTRSSDNVVVDGMACKVGRQMAEPRMTGERVTASDVYNCQRACLAASDQCTTIEYSFTSGYCSITNVSSRSIRRKSKMYTQKHVTLKGSRTGSSSGLQGQCWWHACAQRDPWKAGITLGSAFTTVGPTAVVCSRIDRADIIARFVATPELASCYAADPRQVRSGTRPSHALTVSDTVHDQHLTESTTP